MTTSDQINELAEALAQAQGKIEGAVKDKTNPHYGSRYATLDAVREACRMPLSLYGLSVVQPIGRLEDGTLCTYTRLLHRSGQWLQDGGTPLLLSKDDMQGLGSALTYSRRFGLMAMVGIAPEDDDGNAAVQKGAAPTLTIEAPTDVPAPTLPSGAVLLKKVEKKLSAKGKPYWLYSLSDARVVKDWEEPRAKFAEQAAQLLWPVVVEVKDDPKWGASVKSLTRADIIKTMPKVNVVPPVVEDEPPPLDDSDIAF